MPHQPAEIPIVDRMNRISAPQGSFYIDQYEVTELAKGDYFSIPYQLPVIAATHHAAQQICQLIGKRLCNRYEWIHACLGIASHYISRQQNRRQQGNQQQNRRQQDNQQQNRRQRDNQQQRRQENCNRDSVALVLTGSRSSCRSDFGPYDMIGNAMEWVADQPSGRQVMAMGGSYRTPQANCFTTHYFPLDASSAMVGFRCCR